MMLQPFGYHEVLVVSAPVKLRLSVCLLLQSFQCVQPFLGVKGEVAVSNLFMCHIKKQSPKVCP